MTDRSPGRPLGRVNPIQMENLFLRRRVVPGMEPINETHVAEPGLAVVEIAAAVTVHDRWPG